MSWVGLGFVATAENAAPDLIATLPIEIVCPQICWGMGYPDNDPGLNDTVVLFNRCKELGLGIAGWGWCAYPDQAEEEAAYHASVCNELGLGRYVANMEEPYDGHGDQSNPKMWAPDRYAQSFHQAAPNVTLGLTTTPRWGSSGNGFRAVGATIMPQAFTGEVPSATIPACVSHAQAWGWALGAIRPLVQVYKTNGVRPSATTYNEDAANCNVGVVPYTLEQALDGEGQEMLKTLGPSILREPAETPVPPEPEPEPPHPPESPPDLPFKRALYPPDAKAKGKTPSPDGSDIVAVKRAVSRAGGSKSGNTGYWKWQSFDDTYSNGFSHGNSANGSGVEGFQADHVDLKGKPPSGWYGSTTHEALRTFVIPSGPNKGQWAFDSKACQLYRSA